MLTLSEGRVASPLGFTLTGVSVAQLHFQLSDGCNAVAGETTHPKERGSTLCERLLVCIKAKIFAQVSKRTILS